MRFFRVFSGFFGSWTRTRNISLLIDFLSWGSRSGKKCTREAPARVFSILREKASPGQGLTSPVSGKPGKRFTFCWSLFSPKSDQVLGQDLAGGRPGKSRFSRKSRGESTPRVTGERRNTTLPNNPPHLPVESGELCSPEYGCSFAAAVKRRYGRLFKNFVSQNFSRKIFDFSRRQKNLRFFWRAVKKSLIFFTVASQKSLIFATRAKKS